MRRVTLVSVTSPAILTVTQRVAMGTEKESIPAPASERQIEAQGFLVPAWTLSQPLKLREQVWVIWVPPMMLSQ